MPQASLQPVILALALFIAQAPAQDLPATITALTSDPAVARANWGIMVTGIDGTTFYSLNEKKLFQPASNNKLFTTAAALALLNHDTFETRIVGKGHFTTESLVGNLILIGDGDANLSGRTIPYAPPSPNRPAPAPALRYLEEMADTVAKSGLKTIIGDIVGDARLFPWEPYPIDWSVDDLVWGYGAPVSALTINDNQIKVTVTPGARPGLHPIVALDPAIPYYVVDTSGLFLTMPGKSGSHIGFARDLGSKRLRISGTIAVDSQPDVEEIAIADPAEYAAIALKSMLEARGITVTGTARADHFSSGDTESFQESAHEPIKELDPSGRTGYEHGSARRRSGCDTCDAGNLPGEKLLASHLSASIPEDVTITNKVSQNLHAELLLHQLSAAVIGDGSTAQGARVIRQFAVNAGVDPNDFIFYDGSGMSGHDLITPRAIAKLLQFATKQPWFADYKASLPIGGVDGSLEHRFTAAPLKGHVFAKTGTLGEARALSGYLDCASGRTVIFSILVGNHDPTTSADRGVMDKIVAAIAAAN